MQIVASATVSRGKKTNRLKIKRKADMQAQRAVHRYKQDPTARGMDVVVIGVSLPVRELAIIDAACEQMQMARSHFLREAARQLIEARRK